MSSLRACPCSSPNALRRLHPTPQPSWCQYLSNNTAFTPHHVIVVSVPERFGSHFTNSPTNKDIRIHQAP
ncbi:hypothetical protein CDL15_Pgr025016 [Punica granatum]|uniref:Uncharacterized protein n=1 Tax=Punica granatum TaxID=22663 RepID=A0A218W8K6_PUNGR|nr:hypothetical protein CDL15_Pgr025016 [Punica granatum]